MNRLVFFSLWILLPVRTAVPPNAALQRTYQPVTLLAKRRAREAPACHAAELRPIAPGRPLSLVVSAYRHLEVDPARNAPC